MSYGAAAAAADVDVAGAEDAGHAARAVGAAGAADAGAAGGAAEDADHDGAVDVVAGGAAVA